MNTARFMPVLVSIVFGLIVATSLLAHKPAYGQAELNPASNQPLEISADGTLEWHRDNQQYIARGNAEARQGGVRISAETLTADYQETGGGGLEIYRLTAVGQVTIESQDTTAYGDHIVYEVAQGLAVMTGQDLRLVSPDQTVTAQDRFEYWVNIGRLNARGHAQVVRGTDQIDADEMAAIFTEDHTGSRALQRLEAEGNVVITTPNEILTGHKGLYEAASNIAELIGNVSITRGPNVLQGERAEVNLTTNVSRMHGSGTGAPDGRVRGLFFPDSAESRQQPSVATNPDTAFSPPEAPEGPRRMMTGP